MTDKLIEAVARAISPYAWQQRLMEPAKWRGKAQSNAIEAARAALKAIEDSGTYVMTKWQPIDTAPKDGTVVLGYFPDGIKARDYPHGWGERIYYRTIMRWGTANDYDGESQWIVPFPDIDPGVYDDPSFDCWAMTGNPTHWMPLPAPPDRENGT